MRSDKRVVCPDCGEQVGLSRREFMQVAAGAVLAPSLTLFAEPKQASAAPALSSSAETAAKALYASLTPAQRKIVCFDWDYRHPERGLLRTHVSNNWQITKPTVASDFYTKEQQHLIHDVFKSLFHPDWYLKLVKQLRDDSGGRPWGAAQSIALFGSPDSGKFMFVMTGRHLTIRADGNSEQHVALGGPIFHGHAASGFNEKVGHPGNIFWHQAVLANQVYQILDGKQQRQALVDKRPQESDVPFRGPQGLYPGIPVAELSADQKEALKKVLHSLIEPYRPEDQQEIIACLDKQGGLDRCSLAFYKEGDLGNDGEWDNWRLEGPSFVWYFRGFPHVHIWINVADDPSVPLNARG
ncbi:MAG: hypothetical protein C4297_00785 [Gemmataceae bacterium]